MTIPEPDKTPRVFVAGGGDVQCPTCGGAQWTAADYGHPWAVPDGVREKHELRFCIVFLRAQLEELRLRLQ